LKLLELFLIILGLILRILLF